MEKTLEEAADNYSSHHYSNHTFNAFIEGAKWQAEKSYSEENMKKAFCAGFASNVTSSINDAFEKWFEQFKKK
jgi:hypothetical protein